MEEKLEIFDCIQGSEEWFNLRAGIPTASNFADVLAKGQGKTRRKYMLQLVGEILTGQAADHFTNVHTDRGKEMEPEARELYSILYQPTEVVGFMKRGRVGASPDSLIGAAGLLEIKTKLPHLHLEALLAGQLPPEHKAQCQGQLWIADREWLDFMSYWPGLPPFVVRVERDEEYIETLETAVEEFIAEMDELVVNLKARGAAPTKWKPKPMAMKENDFIDLNAHE